MPHHKNEEEATGHLTDQVAKDSADSTASTDTLHDVDTGAKEGKDTGGMKATVADHTANPGPVRAENLPEPASREELSKRSAELNK